MNAFDLSSYIEPVVKSCKLWKDKDLQMIVIANPNAGGFTRAKINFEQQEILKLFSEKALKMPVLCNSFNFLVYECKENGSAKRFVKNTIKEACLEENQNKQFLLLIAGGDGTYLEVLTALAQVAFDLKGEYEEAIKNRITVLRLPFGTGNDGADGENLEECLNLLINNSHFALQRAVRVSCQNFLPAKTENCPPWYSFNIASIGIDAFITQMTNKTKNIFPGNFYKIWIDLACVFYRFFYKAGNACIFLIGKNDEILQTFQMGIEYALLGVSGYRTYGSKQKILPNENNVCIAKKMSLLKKLKIKGKVKSGKHANLKEIILAKAEKLKIEYDKKILVQMDGEAHLLKKENFPIIIERTEAIIRIIENDESQHNKGTERC